MNFKKAAILSLSILTIMATDIVAPLISQISNSFPDVDPTLIKQSITLPSLLAIFFGLVAGQLVKTISKKAVLVIALILYAVGGLAAGWSQTFANHLCYRGILGAGTGMISPIITSLIADFFKGKERANMVGYSFAASHFGGVVAPPLAAILGAQDWRKAFYIYAVSLLVFILTMLFIPRFKSQISSAENRGEHTSIPSIVYWLSAASFILVIFFFIIITDITFLIETKPSIAGYVNTFGLSISTLGSTISGLAFSRAYLKMKKWTAPIGLFITALGFLLILYTYNSIIMLFGLLCTGLGIGLIFSLIVLVTANAVGESDSTAALAFVNSAFSVGIFASPFFYALVPGMIAHQPDIIYNFQLAGRFFLITGILSIPITHFSLGKQIFHS